jgi:hypothetical protein
MLLYVMLFLFVSSTFFLLYRMARMKRQLLEIEENVRLADRQVQDLRTELKELMASDNRYSKERKA